MKKVFFVGVLLSSWFFLSGCNPMFNEDFGETSDLTGAPTSPETCFKVAAEATFRFSSEDYYRVLTNVQIPRDSFNEVGGLIRLCIIGVGDTDGQWPDCTTNHVNFRLISGVPGSEIWYAPRNWQGEELIDWDQSLRIDAPDDPDDNIDRWSLLFVNPQLNPGRNWFDGGGPETVPFDIYVQNPVLIGLEKKGFVKGCKIAGGQILLTESDREEEMPNIFFEKNDIVAGAGVDLEALDLKQYYVKLGEMGKDENGNGRHHGDVIGTIRMQKQTEIKDYKVRYWREFKRIYLIEDVIDDYKSYIYSGTDSIANPVPTSTAKTLKLEALYFTNVDEFRWYTP